MKNIVNRRDLLSTTAIAGMIGATGSTVKAEIRQPATAAVSAELQSMIDAFVGLKQDIKRLDTQMAPLEAAGKCHGVEGVTIREYCQNELDYSPGVLSRKFHCVDDLDSYYNMALTKGWETPEVVARKTVDREKARRLIVAERAEIDAWSKHSGYGSLVEKWEAIFDQSCDLEKQICLFECRSQGDLTAKIRFAQSWLNSDELDESVQHAEILRSMFGVVNVCDE